MSTSTSSAYSRGAYHSKEPAGSGFGNGASSGTFESGGRSNGFSPTVRREVVAHGGEPL